MSGPGGIIDDHNRSATNLSNLSGVSSSRGSPSSPVSVPAADSAPQSMTLSPLVPATNSTPAMFLDTPNRGSNDTSEERHDDAKKGQKLVIRLSDVEASARVNAGESSLALNNRKDSPISPPTSASPPLTMGESHSSSAPPKSFSQSRLRPGPHQHTAVTALRTPQSMPPSPLARASSYGSQLSNAVNAVGREMVRLVLNRKDGSGRDGSESPSGRKSNSPDGSPLIQGLPVLTPPPRVDTDEDLLSRQVLWEIDRTEIDMRGSKELGTGGYGMVVLARWRGTPVAIKMVNVPSGNQGGNAGGGGHPGNAQIRSSAAFSELRHEIAVMSHMHHPRIVQFLGACTRAQPWMLIFEYMPGGALSTILENAASKGQRVPPKQAARWTLGIAQGLRYLHEHKPRPVVHRDLKPGNVLIDHADNAKISDFGACCRRGQAWREEKLYSTILSPLRPSV